MCGEKVISQNSCARTAESPPRVRRKGLQSLHGCPSGRITPACAGKSCVTTSAGGAPEDHPRVCGEKQLDGQTIASAVGSPPRVRGKDSFRFPSSLSTRITPACAGKRMGDSSLRTGCLGSPPRVRGKGLARAEDKPIYGITPACAGKRYPGTSYMPPWRDHPRVCGEKSQFWCPATKFAGSPPRVRGKAISYSIQTHSARITPACAGKSDATVNHIEIVKDHPRVCGEKSRSHLFSRLHVGSPPRVRGKEDGTTHWTINDGITPACAGKSLIRSRTGGLCRDHPRVCGEKGFRERVGRRCPGSPPRVRGKGVHFQFHACCRGITPACAGKSRVKFLVRVVVKDHPRVCGEKSRSHLFSRLHVGSPPRVRGKVAYAHRRRSPWRITPACAGKSDSIWYPLLGD